MFWPEERKFIELLPTLIVLPRAKAEERGRARGLRLLFMHTSVQNLAMINFASTNCFKFEKYLKEFWGEGSGDAFLLTKEIAATE